MRAWMNVSRRWGALLGLRAKLPQLPGRKDVQAEAKQAQRALLIMAAAAQAVASVSQLRMQNTTPTDAQLQKFELDKTGTLAVNLLYHRYGQAPVTLRSTLRNAPSAQ